MKLMFVVGARPNFIKISPLIKAARHYGIRYSLTHTGQHYDDNMSKKFFEELEIEEPDVSLNINSVSELFQISYIIKEFSIVCKSYKPDMVVVVGDVNSTMACSIAVSRLDNIKLAHVEAGCRSFDKSMPEETNRIITDVLSDYLFTISNSHKINLFKEGIKDNIFVVGDIMSDTLLQNIDKIKPINTKQKSIVVTIHRKSNVENKANLEHILYALHTLSKDFDIIFPVHPRTMDCIKRYKLLKYLENIKVYKPMGYFELLSYVVGSEMVITDSGGLSLESSILNKICVVPRNNFERDYLNNIMLTGPNVSNIIDAVYNPINFIDKHSDLVDGNVAMRIMEILYENCNSIC
jgi:UDP-N-acetylglucosamine 2-epimerase (non-hydrolysing)